MRAAWIATVSNIDWPSSPGLSTAQQKAELIALMDCASRLRLNTLIFQVRAGCDAMYASELEPWSEYLTGTMGKAPEPFYDPLSFAVQEAHKRGLELHAWFNPYRARYAAAKSSVAPNHVSKTRPQLVRRYGKSLWLDPGQKQVQDYSIGVIMDVVRRYDLDGVHIDDYFYPYKEKDGAGKELEFPDEATWQRYGTASGLGRDDWRRENVNRFVQRLYNSIKEAKPWVKFGVSPFGIWRPGNPAQIQGFDAYAKLYADSRQWLASGWVDYLAPQLYWAIKPPEQSFPVLLKWWAAQNPKGRLLVPGMDSTKAAHKWPSEEIVEQIRLTRKQAGTAGQVHWNMGALSSNATLAGALERETYLESALVPACPWCGGSAPEKPALSLVQRGASIEATWTHGTPTAIRFWLMQTRSNDRWTSKVIPGDKRSVVLDQSVPDTVALTAIDRYGNASEPAVLKRK
jgi:uncharacterized lipoprotein YddW (UPF0748 family)